MLTILCSQFQITITLTSVGLAFVSSVASSNEQSVLTAVQLMWVNLFQDTLAALALATDPPSRKVLDRKPEPRSSPLITIPMWKMIIGQSIYQLAVTLVLHFAGSSIFSYTPDDKDGLQTAVFNTYVWMQIFNMYKYVSPCSMISAYVSKCSMANPIQYHPAPICTLKPYCNEYWFQTNHPQQPPTRKQHQSSRGLIPKLAIHMCHSPNDGLPNPNYFCGRPCLLSCQTYRYPVGILACFGGSIHLGRIRY